jgi:hypothetical protein
MLGGHKENIAIVPNFAVQFLPPASGEKRIPMKITRVVVMAAIAAASAWANERPAESRQLTICMESITDSSINYQARLASDIFAVIGVKIWWVDPLKCPTEAIYISFSKDTPASDHPGALAYAMPYEGSHIMVFLDRVKEMAPCTGGRLLAYTLAHEIAHILEGLVRHSRSGIMKARWGPDEHYQMSRGRLGFAAEDVDLIYQGLDRRESRLTASASSAGMH